MGICEAGLAETIDYVLKLFSLSDQQQLVNNIFITGGLAQIPGLKERLWKEMMEIRPFQSTYAIKLATNPTLDAWHGARKFATTGNNVNSFSVNKAEYEEKGGEFLKENCLSNRYYKTPLEKLDSSII